MEATVIVVNHRTIDLVERCLRTIDLRDCELMVVDSASRDGSVERLRSIGVDVLELDENRGFAAALNAGMRRSSSPYVVVMNADVECHPGALRLLVERLKAETSRALVAPPRLVDVAGVVQSTAYRRFPGPATIFLELCAPAGDVVAHIPKLDWYRVTTATLERGGEVAHVQGAVMAIRRLAWEETGGPDEAFFLYLEETEWQQRLHDAGWTIGLVSEAICLHLGRGGERALAPSVEFVRSAEHYLLARGCRPGLARGVIACALLTSRMRFRVLGLFPRHEARAKRGAREWDVLWRAWKRG